MEVRLEKVRAVGGGVGGVVFSLLGLEAVAVSIKIEVAEGR